MVKPVYPVTTPPEPIGPHELRIECDAFGRPVRVFIGPRDITPLVVRVQTNTTLNETTTEVVLLARAPSAMRLDARP